MRLSFMTTPTAVMYLKNEERDMVQVFHEMANAKRFLDLLTQSYKLTQLKPHIAQVNDGTELVCHELEDVLEYDGPPTSINREAQYLDAILYLRGMSAADRRHAYLTQPHKLAEALETPAPLRRATHSPKQPRLAAMAHTPDTMAVEMGANPSRLRQWLRKHYTKPDYGWSFTDAQFAEIKKAFK